MRKCIICGKDLPHQVNKSNKVYEAQRFCSNQCIGKYKSAERNNNWKGDNVGYDALHTWIERLKGSPAYCEHCDRTDRKKYEWANIDHKYKRDGNDFIRLCTSCHRKWDNERFFKPKFDVEEAKRLKALGYSYRKIARELGIGSHGTIQKQLEENYPNYNKTY